MIFYDVTMHITFSLNQIRIYSYNCNQKGYLIHLSCNQSFVSHKYIYIHIYIYIYIGKSCYILWIRSWQGNIRNFNSTITPICYYSYSTNHCKYSSTMRQSTHCKSNDYITKSRSKFTKYKSCNQNDI